MKWYLHKINVWLQVSVLRMIKPHESFSYQQLTMAFTAEMCSFWFISAATLALRSSLSFIDPTYVLSACTVSVKLQVTLDVPFKQLWVCNYSSSYSQITSEERGGRADGCNSLFTFLQPPFRIIDWDTWSSVRQNLLLKLEPFNAVSVHHFCRRPLFPGNTLCLIPLNQETIQRHLPKDVGHTGEL